MSRYFLSDYFTGVAAKRLSQVEINLSKSNQHEFAGIKPFVGILGSSKQRFQALFIYFGNDEEDTIAAEGTLTWYDSRENKPDRSAEFRLYFPASPVTERANAGDLLVLGRRLDGTLLVIITQEGSTAENQVLWLFGIDHTEGKLHSKIEVREIEKNGSPEIGFAEQFVLEQLGIDIDDADTNFIDILIERFPNGFPTTREFSAFARQTMSVSPAAEDPDLVLWQWMEREEMLFRTFEKHVIGERLRVGFADDVDEFISFSLSVQNRRKSRVGHAFENHLEQLFVDNGIRFSRGKVTENKSKPDFIFPGIDEYRNPAFPASQLLMLGVKTTCKDRWRQVLTEAARISSKHLATLEPGISISQTEEMKSQSLSLVLPCNLHETYMPSQRGWLISISGFISQVRHKQ